MGSNNCFSKIIADVFPPWHRVNTHLNAAEQQTDKTSAFIELLTLTDDQLISALISSCYLPSYGSCTGDSVVHSTSWPQCRVFVNMTLYLDQF